MSSPREGPNPLRPYHIPAPAVAEPTSSPRERAQGAGPSSASKHASSLPRTAFGTSARDAFSDFDYGDYLPEASPPVAEVLKNLADQGLWKYASVLLSQPFDLAKTVLQVQDAAAVAEGAVDAQEKPSRAPSSRAYARDYDVS